MVSTKLDAIAESGDGWFDYDPLPIAASAMITIGVNSLYNFPYHVATTALVAVTWMGLFEVLLRQGENK